MSSIDNRIVQMQFENSEFEKGVKESLKSLDQLKESLKLDEAAEGLRKLQAAGDSFSLAGISDEVEGLSNRFSAFGTFAGRIIENLADTIYNKLGAALKSVTIGQIGSGWQKYADDTKAVQTIMMATGNTIEEVEGELQKLTWFTDETSYSYQDMVSNISKFTSMDIPLEDARIQMEGIAAWAAAAGQGAAEAGRVMYNVSQAVGAGGMKLVDWKSVQNANMATADFKKHAIESAIALGRLNKEAQILEETGTGKKKKTKVTTVGVDNFAQTLSSGWFDTAVMEDVFKRYGKFSEEVYKLQQEYKEKGIELQTSDAMKILSEQGGDFEKFSEEAFRAAQEAKTLTDAIEALKDATSTKWLNIFKLIFGNYEEAKELWTKLANDLYDIFVSPLDDFIDVLRDWHMSDELGNWHDFMQGVYDIMDGLKGILVTVRDAFANLIPPATLESLQHFGTAVKDFGAIFKAMFGIPEEESGEAVKEVKKAEKAVEKSSDKASKSVEKDANAAEEEILKAANAVSVVEDSYTSLEHNLKRGEVSEDVKQMQEMLIAAGYNLDKFGADGIFGPETQAALRQFQKEAGLVVDGIYGKASEQALTDYLGLDEANKQFEELENSLKRGSRGLEVRKLQKRLKELGYDIGDIDGIFGPKTEAGLLQFQKDAGIAVDGAYDAEDHAIMKTKLGFEEVAEQAEEVSDNVAETAKQSGEVLDATEKYGNALDKISSIFGGLAATGGIVLKVVGGIGRVVGYIWKLTLPLQDALLTILATVGDALISFNDWLGTSGKIDQWVESIEKHLEPVGAWMQKIADAILVFLEIKEPIEGANEEIITFSKLWKSISDYVKKSDAFKYLLSTFDVIKTSFANIVNSFKTIDLDNIDIGGSFIKILGWIGKAILTLVTPIAYVINKLSEFVAFLIGKLPEGINKIKEFWDGLDIDADSKFGGIRAVFAKAKEIFIDIKDFWFGSNKDGNVKEGMFSRIGKLISGDIEGFKKGFGDETIKNVSAVFTSIRQFIYKVGNAIKRLFSGNGSEDILTGEAIQKIDLIRSGISKIISAVSMLFLGNRDNKINLSGIEKAIIDFRNFVIYAFGKVKEGIVFVWESIKDFISSINLKSWEDFKASLSNIWENIKNTISGFFNGIGQGVSKTVDSFGESAAALFVWGLIFVSLGIIIYRVFKFVKNVVDIIGNFSEYLRQKTQKEVQPLSEKILQFSIAVSLIAGSLYLLTKLKPGEFFKGLGYLGSILLILGVFVVLAKKFGKDEGGKAVSRMADSLLQFSISLAILSGVVAALSIFTPEAFWKGYKYLAAMVGLVIAFSGIMALINKIGYSNYDGGGIKSVAIAILALTIVLKMLSKMDYNKFVSGFEKLVAIMLVILPFMLLFNIVNRIGKGNTAKGLLQVIGAITLLTGVIAILGILPVNVLEKGITGLITIMGSLLVFMTVLNIVSRICGGINATGILSIAGVILSMVLSIGLLGILPVNTLVKGLVGLTVIMLLLGGLMKKINKYGSVSIKGIVGLIPIVLAIFALSEIFITMANRLKRLSFDAIAKALLGFVIITISLKSVSKSVSKSNTDLKGILSFILSAAALSGAMIAFGYALSMVKDIPSDSIMSFALSLSEIGIAFGLIGAIAGKLGAGTTFLGIVAVAAGIAVVLAAFSAILKIPGIDEFLSGGAEKIGKIIGAFTGSMKAAEIESFNKAASQIESINGVDQEKVNNAIAAAQAIADFGAGLPAKGLIEQAADFIFGSELKQFSGDMAAFGEGFNTFATELNTIAGSYDDLPVKTDAAIKIAKSIQAFGEGLPEKGIIEKAADRFFGSELKQFSGDMAEFGVGFNSYATQITSINADAVAIEANTSTAIAIAESIKAFADTLEKKSVAETIVESKFGSELSQFSTDIVDFSTGYNSYAGIMSAITGDAEAVTANTSTAISIASSIKEFSDTLKDKSVAETIVESRFGSKLSQFSTSIVNFSTGYNSYAAAMSAISGDAEAVTANTSTAISIASSIKEFSDTLKDKSVAETVVESRFGSKLSQFSSDIVNFSTGYNSYAAAMSSINADANIVTTNTTTAIAIATSIKDFADTLEKKTISETVFDSWFGSETKQFSTDMSTFATKFDEYATTMNGITADPANVIEKTGTAISIATQISTFLEELKGKDIETKYEGIKGWLQGGTKGETVIDTVGKLAEAIGNSVDSFALVSDGSIVENVKHATSVLTEIATFLDFLSSDDIQVSATATADDWGSYNVEDKFGVFIEQLSKVAGGIVTFSGIVEGIDIEGISSVIHSVVDFLNYVASGFSDVTLESIESLDIGAFGAKLGDSIAAMASSLEAYKEDFKTAGINFDLGLAEGVTQEQGTPITAVGNLAQAMLNKVAEVLDEHSPSWETFMQGVNFIKGLTNGITDESRNLIANIGDVGGNALSTLAESLSNSGIDLSTIFGDGFSLEDFMDMLKGVDLNNLNLESLEKVFNDFDVGIIDKDSLVNQIKSALTEAGDEIEEFKSEYSTSNVISEALKYGSRGDAVKQMQEQLMALGYNLDKFGADGIFGPETQAAVNDFKKDMGLAMDGVFDTNAATKIAEALSGSQAVTTYTEAGTKIVTYVSEGMEKGDTKPMEKFVSSVLTAANDHAKDFKTAGENFANGLVNGVYFKTSVAVEAAAYVARQMVNAVKNAFQTASPSKVTTKFGEYFAQGLAIGTDKEGVKAIRSSKAVAENMVNITKDTLKPLSSILLEDIDDTPVIRPVVDMSNIENARDLMGMYFGKGNYNQMVSTEMAQKIQSDALKYKKEFNISDSDMSVMDPNHFSKYIGDFDKGKASNSFTSEINSKFDKLAEIMTGMKVVLDTGELVGATASAYDKEFGKFTGRRERGN